MPPWERLVAEPSPQTPWRVCACIPNPGCNFHLAPAWAPRAAGKPRSEEHTSELQSRFDLVCRLLLEKKKKVKLITTLVTIFFFNDTPPTSIYTLSLHDALPILS